MTTTAEGWETKFLNGLGQYLDDQGVGDWSPTGTYTEDQIGITVDSIVDTPTRLITLSYYLVDSAPGLADVRGGVQVRVRGDNADPRVRNDIASACYDALHGLHDVVVGGIALVGMWWQSGSPLGQDINDRYERADNFYVDAMRPTSFNTD